MSNEFAPEHLLNIEEWSVHTALFIRRSGFTTPEKLLRKTKAEMRRVPGCKERYLREIKEKLEKKGMKLDWKIKPLKGGNPSLNKPIISKRSARKKAQLMGLDDYEWGVNHYDGEKLAPTFGG